MRGRSAKIEALNGSVLWEAHGLRLACRHATCEERARQRSGRRALGCCFLGWVLGHVGPDPLYCAGIALPSTRKARQQVLVIDSILTQGGWLDATRFAIGLCFGEELFDHSAIVGLLSDYGKEYNPIAARIIRWDKCAHG